MLLRSSFFHPQESALYELGLGHVQNACPNRFLVSLLLIKSVILLIHPNLSKPLESYFSISSQFQTLNAPANQNQQIKIMNIQIKCQVMCRLPSL